MEQAVDTNQEKLLNIKFTGKIRISIMKTVLVTGGSRGIGKVNMLNYPWAKHVIML